MINTLKKLGLIIIGVLPYIGIVIGVSVLINNEYPSEVYSFTAFTWKQFLNTLTVFGGAFLWIIFCKIIKYAITLRD